MANVTYMNQVSVMFKNEIDRRLPEADKNAPYGSFAKWLTHAMSRIAAPATNDQMFQEKMDQWAEFVRKVAIECVRAQSNNEIACIFHAVHTITGNRCACSSCNK
jgi:hypothetical protein